MTLPMDPTTHAKALLDEAWRWPNVPPTWLATLRDLLVVHAQHVEEVVKTRAMLITEAGMQEDQPSTLYDVAASVVYAAKRFQRQRDEMALQLMTAGEEIARLRAELDALKVGGSP